MVREQQALLPKKLGRHFIGIDESDEYIKHAQTRIDAIDPLKRNLIESKPKRALPRIPFGNLIESGLLQPGTTLHAPKGKHKVTVHADGTVMAQNHVNKYRGSIHKVGAALQDAPSCNGWTYWHFEKEGKMLPIDAMRNEMRQKMLQK